MGLWDWLNPKCPSCRHRASDHVPLSEWGPGRCYGRKVIYVRGFARYVACDCPLTGEEVKLNSRPYKDVQAVQGTST